MLHVDRIIRAGIIIHVTRTIQDARPDDAPGRHESSAPYERTPPGPADRVMSIFHEFRAALGEMRCAASQGMLRHGISMTQVHVLTMLEHHGEMPMSRLAEMLGVSLSNATGLIDRLEEAGLVERLRDGEDRRVVLVRAAQSGRQALHEVQLLRDDMMRRLLTRLDHDQLTRLEASMADLRDAVTAEARDGFGGREHLHPHQSRTTEGIDR